MIFCFCIDVLQIYEGNEFNKMFEALSELKNKNLKANKKLIEKRKKLNENPDFEQNYCSKQVFYQTEHDGTKKDE